MQDISQLFFSKEVCDMVVEGKLQAAGLEIAKDGNPTRQDVIDAWIAMLSKEAGSTGEQSTIEQEGPHEASSSAEPVTQDVQEDASAAAAESKAGAAESAAR
jgi:hypothetical protein